MAIKRITVEESENFLKQIDVATKPYGVSSGLEGWIGRDACILAEAIFTAVDNHRAANRKPRPPKVVTPNA